MKRNYILYIALLMLILIMPLSISGVSSSWVYTDGNVPFKEFNPSCNLGYFNYVTDPNNHDNNLNNQYPDSQQGVKDHNEFDKILGELNSSGDSLNNMNSILNQKDLTGTNLPSSGYITSVDDMGVEANNEAFGIVLQRSPYRSGKDVKASLGLDENTEYLIYKRDSGVSTQTWEVYTTTTNIKGLNKGEIIHDVYKIVLEWNHKSGEGLKNGDYTIKSSERGYCEVVTLKKGVNTKKDTNFFTPDSWQSGIYKYVTIPNTNVENEISAIRKGKNITINLVAKDINGQNINPSSVKWELIEPNNKKLVELVNNQITVKSNNVVKQGKDITIVLKGTYNKVEGLQKFTFRIEK